MQGRKHAEPRDVDVKTLRRWVCQAERDALCCPGLMTDERQRLKETRDRGPIEASSV